MAKRRPQKLTEAEVDVLGSFSDAIATAAAEKTSASRDEMSTGLREFLRDRLDRFDYDGTEPDLWEAELACFADDVVNEILKHARAFLQDCMGKQAWGNLGNPF